MHVVCCSSLEHVLTGLRGCASNISVMLQVCAKRRNSLDATGRLAVPRLVHLEMTTCAREAALTFCPHFRNPCPRSLQLPLDSPPWAGTPSRHRTGCADADKSHRRPNQLILEYFERGPKLEDASNRYQHTCKSCGEKVRPTPP